MAFKPTAQQQAALDARGTVLVSAAAGSGKTAVLSNRVVRRVTDSENPVDITDLLIVTFTNAAAEEMRERISSLLGEAVRNNPDNHRIMRQKLAVESAHIETIDSFCIDLVRDNFADAGVNPDFRIISQDRFAVISAKQVTDAYIELSETDYDGYTRLLTSLGCETVDEKACRAVTDIYTYIRSLPMPERWLDEAENMYSEFTSLDKSAWLTPILQYIFDVADYNLAALNSVTDLMNTDSTVARAYGDTVDYLKKVLSNIRDSAGTGDYNAAYSALRSYIPIRLSAVRSCDSEDVKNTVKAAIDQARDGIKKLVSTFTVSAQQAERDIGDAAITVKTLINLVRVYSDKMQSAMNERGMLDFAGVELAALRLLCEEVDGELRIRDSARHLCERYAEVMVDEYQDTNDLQNAVFNALSGGGERLFLVGDVKQSIYRFRQANPRNFIRLRDSFPDYGAGSYPAKIDLSGNFRSRPEICDFVNFCFGLLMSRDACEIDYLDGDKLDSKGSFDATDEDSVELHFLDTDEVEAQAQHIAQYIKSCVASGMKVSGDNGLRPVRYGDFTVLLRSFKKYAPQLVRAMKNNGVPVCAELNTQFFDRPEIMMIMSLLNAVDNPLRDIPLLSAMMSPIFGFTADETAEMRAEDKKCSLYSSLLAFAKRNDKAQAFVDRLTKYRLWADSMPTDRLISRIYDDTGLTAVVRAMEDGASRRANLLSLAEYAADFERNASSGLSAFLRHADSVSKSGIMLGGASVTEGDDAVHVMTIHKSKGLQAPVCIVAGMENAFNSADSRSALLMHEDYGIGMRVCDLNRAVRYDTLSRIAISLKEHEASVAEEMRLLYVAMTRAQDKLVLVTGDKKLDEHLQKSIGAVTAGWRTVGEPIDALPVKSVNKMSEWLMMCLVLHPDAGELRERAGANITPTPTEHGVKIRFIPTPDIHSNLNEQKRESEYADFSQMLDYRYPYERLLSVESKYSVSELSKSIFADGSALKARPAFITGDTMTAAEKGTATHRFMCYADFDRAEHSVADEAQLLVASGKLTAEQAGGIDTEAVTAFFDSDIYRRLRLADRVLRESRFIFEITASEIVPDCASDEPVIVQGVADCVIFESDGIVIVDFKTDRNTTADELVKKYAKQLDLYARAFSYNYKMPVKQCSVYSFSLRETVDIPLERRLL